MWKWAKRFLGAGLVAGVAYGVWRALDEESRRSKIDWTPQPFPAPPMPVPRDDATAPIATTADTTWVEPQGGACPTSHPVKAKVGSGIFHAPGGQMYDRTVPDRCYTDAAAAEADGLRASKR